MRVFKVWFDGEKDEPMRIHAFSEKHAIDLVVELFVKTDTDYKGASPVEQGELYDALNAEVAD